LCCIYIVLQMDSTWRQANEGGYLELLVIG